MNIRTVVFASLTAFAFLSCQGPEITSPYDTPVDDFGVQGTRTGTIIVPYMPQRSNNIVYLTEEHFIVQVVIYNLPEQTFRGWFEVLVPTCIMIDTINANPKYFDPTGSNSIFVKLIDTRAQMAQYAVSYKRDATVKTKSSGVLCNLVCRPRSKGTGTIKFPTLPVVERIEGSNVVGAKGGIIKPVVVECDSLQVIVKDRLDG